MKWTAAFFLLFALSSCTATGAGAGDARAEFLRRLDAALASRDAAALEALADWSGWGERRESLDILLPAAPIRRDKVLSTTEVLYKDGEGKTWRAVLRDVDGSLRLVPRARPCPAGGMRRGLDDAGPTRSKPESWSPIECWPLPK